VVLEAGRWLELRRFRVLRDAGASIAEIARETGLNWRTVKKYLEAEGPAGPPVPAPREDLRNRVIAAYAPVIDAWLRAEVLARVGIARVHSFHMVLSYSRDPFYCFTTSQDLAAFWACHRRAFAHSGGVPGSIVYDRTKTVESL
jgi:transposase